jgi:type I restriction enzyme R subunit
VLFLVDRSALGEQAANAFKDTALESLQTFTDIYNIKDLQRWGARARRQGLQIATVQVHRVQAGSSMTVRGSAAARARR